MMYCKRSTFFCIRTLGLAAVLMGLTAHTGLAQDKVSRREVSQTIRQNLPERQALLSSERFARQGFPEDTKAHPYYAYLRDLERQGRVNKADSLVTWMMKNQPSTQAGMLPPFGADDHLYHDCSGP